MCQDLEQKRPGHTVKGPRDVELQKHAGYLEIVEETRCLLHEQEVLVDTPAGDESALVSRNHGPKPRSEPQRQHLCKELCNEVDQANGAVVRKGGGVRALG